MQNRFGIIGRGRIAQRYAKYNAKLGHLGALCDINTEKAHSLAPEYQAKAYYSLDALLESESHHIDVVSVCTPNGLYAEQTIKTLYGGALFTQFSHFIDLLYWFLGDVKYAHSSYKNFQHGDMIEFEDTWVSFLRFHSGTMGTINYTINAYVKNMEASITLFAEKGTIKIGGQYLNELEYQMIEGMDTIEADKSNPPNNYGEYVGSMFNHEQVYQNVIEALITMASFSPTDLWPENRGNHR